jgi:hypothetical protein
MFWALYHRAWWLSFYWFFFLPAGRALGEVEVSDAIFLLLFATYWALRIWTGFKANEWLHRDLLRKGYSFAGEQEAEDSETAYIKFVDAAKNSTENVVGSNS